MPSRTCPSLERIEYPNVKKAHIVPRTYLRRFAIADQISIHLVDSGTNRTVSIDDAAVRRRFYRRHRPDGTPIDDVEWSLSQLEGSVAPLLQSIEDQWPLESEAKHALAEFFAFQAVRGPRWKEWHQDFARETMSNARLDTNHQLESGIWVPKPPGTDDRVEEDLLSDTGRLTRMMGIANKLIYIYGSMRWDLLLFDQGSLVISDHPVVEWPTPIRARKPGSVPTGYGSLNALEVRVPLSPSSALLMTWQDSDDGLRAKRCPQSFAAEINALTVEQAEKQWMHRPLDIPEIETGVIEPISSSIFVGYVPPVAYGTKTHSEVSRLVNAKLGEGPSEEAAIVNVRGTGLD